MQVIISKTNAYANETITLEHLDENSTYSKIVNIEDLQEEQKAIVYQFCEENPNKTIEIPEAGGFKVSLKVVNGTLSDDVKTIEGITNPDIIQKTGMFMDIVNYVITKE